MKSFSVTKLSQLGEFGWIHRIARHSTPSQNVIVGIGDDTAAVFPPSKGHLLLLTCDSVIEGIHFDHSATPFQIGWKAMARNLSDIAAMGGIPLHALVAAALPPSASISMLQGIHRGLLAAAKRFKVNLVGGDTARSRKGIHLTVTLTGKVLPRHMIRRSGARPGNALCVTGTLGGSIRGKHLKFSPRVREAQFLAKHFRPTAMMDLSDGLASDLRRLEEQSGVGFEIWTDRLPFSYALRSLPLSRKQMIHHALRDGEDYELLFSFPVRHLPRLRIEWKRRFRLPLTEIGRVLPKNRGIRLISSPNSAVATTLPRPGYHHFRR